MAGSLLTNPPRLPMVFPSILGADFARMEEDCRQVLDLGAEALHVDVMDGHFVPNLTMGPNMVQSLRKRFPKAWMDVHLMTTHPHQWVEPFAKAGAGSISFHIEVTADHAQHHEWALIRQIREAGCQVGIVINPQTPAQAVEHVLKDVDMVLVMSVNPGFSGQKFMPEVLAKARWLKERLPASVRLQMDGGVGPENISQVLGAGVDTLVAASSLFGAPDRAAAMKALRGAA